VISIDTVRSIFLNEKQAGSALHKLRAVFPTNAIEMERVAGKRREPDPGDYDLAGSAFLAGTAVATMPATGGNLIGNSAMVDISLGDLDGILAMVAKDEQNGNPRRGTRILATVHAADAAAMELAAEIMEDAGGRILEHSTMQPLPTPDSPETPVNDTGDTDDDRDDPDEDDNSDE